MFDTMTGVKIVGGFCGTLLIFLLGNWAGEALYHVGGTAHGDAEGAEMAYAMEVSEDGGGGAEEEEVDFATLMEQADADAGARVFGKCKACHKVDGTNATGPHLDGVVNREVDAVADFGYSGALEEAADVWTPENLFHFLESPRNFAPGTAMSFSGLPSAEDRANVIAYLESTGG
ncbi:c-type cytochrome [Mesobaculum littorinae]|uniref:C-type cytochrome n=1 Tax=Mesobaculum littorinae TaxID=2486419 RepID=A0A438AFG9_9RHOB|nr:c-type cytochrome [Mesobaculum littorinae]RVV97454.1 c-type cytochrome [Mesobaculum littorinae]